MTRKTCQRCNEEKNTSEFTKDRSRGDGLHILCKCCKRKIDKVRYEKHKDKASARWKRRADGVAELIRNAKIGGCVKCGEQFSGCLEFHHTCADDKEFSIASNRNRNVTTILGEIEKCVVLCSNCHKKVHAGILSI